MRTQDYENKQRRAVSPDLLAECQPTHKLFKGGACPACYLAIPVGPYSSEQMADLFGSSHFIGQRRASVPHPADAANPPTEREVQLRAQLVTETARLRTARVALFRAEGSTLHTGRMTEGIADSPEVYRQEAYGKTGIDVEAHDAARAEMAAAEASAEQLNRALRREEYARNVRINTWRAKHPEAT